MKAAEIEEAVEALIHRVLGRVRYNVEIPDRFGKPVRACEWFLVLQAIIDEIVDGTLADMTYDPNTARLLPEASI